jgi:hypothetical protein
MFVDEVLNMTRKTYKSETSPGLRERVTAYKTPQLRRLLG